MKTQLKFLDRYLTIWIFSSMAIGLGLGYFFPSLSSKINSVSSGSTNILLAAGLLLMMYPPLVKVDYSSFLKLFEDKKIISLSLILNWIIGPIFMFLLAILFFPNEPELMSGLVLIGGARCIAMVLVWNELAGGDRNYAAGLVALNSMFQLLTYSGISWLLISVVPPYLGLNSFEIHVPFIEVANAVAVYLGIPFLLGISSRYLLIKYMGKVWFDRKFVPIVSPFTLYALMFTIIIMFSLKASVIISLPFTVVRLAIPLVIYFVGIFLISFMLSKKLGATYSKNAAISFTAAGNNFELAIAVAISVFGLNSTQAMVGVIGPLIEVPALILLVKLSLWMRSKLYSK
jgi:ACR3 family arsenite transporter